MNAEQTGGIVIDSVGGDLSVRAGGDIVAGNKTIINNIVQRIAKELTTTPYKFLASYEIADRDIFYGRDAVIEELAAQVGRHKVILINGASGSGKSSLVNAGLIPRVAYNGYTFVAFREYSDPLAQLQAYFDTARSLSPTQARANAVDGQGSLLQLIRGFGNFPLVIFLDQFERFFVRVADDKRRAFIAAFNRCLQHSEAKDLCFVLAFRREFLGQLTTEFEEQIPDFLNEAYRINLLPLTKVEAREAVLRPLGNTSLRIQYDEDFVDNILLAGLAEQTSGGASIDPPHLQIVCNQLFEAARQRLQARNSVLINRALYDELGGAQSILNTYLDKVVEDVAQDPDRIAVVHSILKSMIDAGTNTRSFVTLEDFKRALPDVNEAEILKFIEKLLDRRVVEERKPAYSLSHEYMVGKVREWFDPRELERKRAEETLARGMMECKNSGALLNRGQVERIRKWLPAPTNEERDLLQASEINYREEERREATRKRLRRISLCGATAFTVLVTVLGAYSWYLTIEADRAKSEALKQRDMAVSRALSANSEAMLPTNPELALLLAREAMRVKPTDEAEFTLRQVLTHTPERTVQALPPEASGRFTLAGSAPDIAVVSGTAVRSAAIWDLTSGGHIANLPAESWGVERIALAKEPNLTAITIGNDRLVLVDTRTWTNLTELRGSYPTFSGDGSTLVLTLGDSIQVWQTRPLHLVRAIRTGFPDQGPPLLTPDGALVLVQHNGAEDNSALFAVQSGELVAAITDFTLVQDDCEARAVLSPDGSQVLGRTEGGGLQLLELSTLRRRALKGDPGWVTCVAFSPDGHKLAVGNRAGAVRIWDLTKDEDPGELRGHSNRVYGVAFSPDGKLLLSNAVDGLALLWDLSSGRDLVRIGGGGDDVNDARFTADGGRIVTSHRDGTLRTWQTKSWVATQEIVGESVLLTKDGRFLVQSGTKEPVALWDVYDGRLRARLDRTFARVNSAAVSPDQSRIIISTDAEVAIWTVAEGKQAAKLEVAGNDAKAVAFSADGKLVATGGNDKAVRIWNAATGQMVRTWAGERPVVDLVIVPSNGSLAAAGWSPDDAADITLRDLDTGAIRLGLLLTNVAGELSLAAGRGRLLIAGGRGIDVWDIDERHKLLGLVGFSDTVTAAREAPGGQFLLSGSGYLMAGGDAPDDGNEVRVWDSHTGRVFARWRASGFPISGVAFGLDATSVVATSYGTARFYWCEICVPANALMRIANERLSRDFTAEERVRYLETSRPETVSPPSGHRVSSTLTSSPLSAHYQAR